VARVEKTLEQILRGNADANIPFSGMRRLLNQLGFEERVRGSHHIYTRNGVAEILNLQPKGSKCKPYQVKQVRHVILAYSLAGEVDA
jgi:predicted RNA binding protein YcfA (HicA-like mRNA interferase family)